MPQRTEHWDATYHRVGETGPSWFQPAPAPSIELLDELGVPAGASVLDVGGGASRLVDHLLDRGHSDVTVLDVSGRGLELARRRLGRRAATVTWVVDDVTRWWPSRTYDVWHDRAVFHFLVDDDHRDAYLGALRAAVPVGGAVVLATFALDGPGQCSGLPVARYDAAGLASRVGPDFEVRATRRELHVTPAGGEQPFTWVGAVRVAGR